MAVKEIKKEQKLLVGKIDYVSSNLDLYLKDRWVIISQSLSSDVYPNSVQVRQQYLSILLEREK